MSINAKEALDAQMPNRNEVTKLKLAEKYRDIREAEGELARNARKELIPIKPEEFLVRGNLSEKDRFWLEGIKNGNKNISLKEFLGRKLTPNEIAKIQSLRESDKPTTLKDFLGRELTPKEIVLIASKAKVESGKN